MDRRRGREVKISEQGQAGFLWVLLYSYQAACGSCDSALLEYLCDWAGVHKSLPCPTPPWAAPRGDSTAVAICISISSGCCMKGHRPALSAKYSVQS